jgi:peptidoglycan/LPS O-acetylase OafA/YrhL
MKLPHHIPQLDVLRGVAVLEVMLYHASDIAPSLHLNPVMRAGYTGVDLFFVLSGFLITGILVGSKDEPHYFKNFYARRALRIWPLYYALLLFTFLLLPAVAPSLREAIFEGSRPWPSFFFFIQNLMVSHPPFDTLRVTWSLAIEEQFYLAWPLIVWLAPRKMLKPLAISGLLLSMAARWSSIIGLTPPLNVYMNTLTRLDGLALGAFLALWIPEADSLTVKRAGMAVTAIALPAAVFVGWTHPEHWAFYSLVAVTFAGLLCVAIHVPALARLDFLKYTGKISYALYLVHVPVFVWMSSGWIGKFFAHTSVLGGAAQVALSFAICYGLAAASWRFFESKFLRLKSRFENEPNTVTPGDSLLASAGNQKR